jgi:hypothetical protein
MTLGEYTLSKSNGTTFDEKVVLAESGKTLGFDASLNPIMIANPVTGTGVAGQVAFWSGTSSQTGDNGLFWDNVNKRLGIGTAVPTSKLEINDVDKTVLDLYRYSNFAINTTDAFAIDKGGTLSLGGKCATGSNQIYGFAAIKGAKETAVTGNIGGYLSFMTSKEGIGSREWMRITSTGNVGIGIKNPLTTLHVVGNGGNDFTLTDASSYTLQIGSGGTSVASIKGDAGSALALGANNSEAMRIISGGNVGIGTVAPSALLALQGNTPTALTGTLAVTNLSATVTGTTTLFTTELNVGDAIKISGVTYQVATIVSATSLTLTTSYAGVTASGLTGYKDSNLFAINNGFGTGLVTVNKSGNVGIGTTNPQDKLSVNGNILITEANKLGFRYSAGDPGPYSYMTGGGATPISFYNLYGSTPTIKSFTFNSNPGGVATETVTILNNGNVGIGTTEPVSALHVGTGIIPTWSGVTYTQVPQVNNQITTAGGEVGYGMYVNESTDNRRVKLFLNDTSNVYGLWSTTSTTYPNFVIGAGTTEFMRVQNNGNVQINNLTASKLVFTDASKNLTSAGIGTSSQFIKGDGTLDSTVYVTGTPWTAVGYWYAGTGNHPTSLSGYGITDTPWTAYLPLSGGTLSGALYGTTIDTTSRIYTTSYFYSSNNAKNSFILNSAGSYMGTVHNNASNEWALGWTDSPTTKGTSILTWNTTGVTITGTANVTSLTASKLVFTDASKNLTSTAPGTSSQFWKGDGSLDSNVYVTGTPWTACSYITLASLSSTATGLTYTNTTGVFSLTTGYAIPTTTEISAWNGVTSFPGFAGSGVAGSASRSDHTHSGYQSTITTGTIAQYFKGDLSLGTFPTVLSSFTNDLGNYGGFVTGTPWTSMNYITLSTLSSTATGLTYTNTTGVFSLTTGYQIPTTTSISAWDALITFPGFGTSHSVAAYGDHTHSYEPGLGNPSVTGYVLSSTNTGTRSWVAQLGMTYPGSGISVSTGTAWGTSLDYTSSGTANTLVYRDGYGDFSAHIITATNFQLSDIRLKTPLTPITSLDPGFESCSFEYLNNPGLLRYGYAAQSILKTNPELTRLNNLGYYEVNNVEVLILEVAALKNRIKILEACLKQ